MDGGTAGLLERDRELSRLADCVRRAQRGDGTFVLVDGEAGIGKTRLLAAAREAALAAGLRVVRARGIEVERDVAFGVVRQLLEAELLAAGAADRARLLEGPAASSRPVFDAAGPAPLHQAGAEAARCLMHGVYWLVANLAARGPLVLAVDDAHWSDARSLEALSYLARRLDGLGVVVIAAVRAQAEDPPALAALRADPAAVRLSPRRLSAAGTAELVTDLVSEQVPPDAVARAHTLTGGNPFLLVELVESLAQAGRPLTVEAVDALGESASESLTSAVMLRLGELGAPAVALARAVAVLDDDAALPQLCALAGLDRSTAIAAARRLVAARILADDLQPRFVHPLLRAAVYRDLSALERAFAHEGAAQVLARYAAAPGRIAAHLLLSLPSDSEEVTESLRAAARDALHKGDPAIAGKYLRRALAEPPPAADRGQVLLELGETDLQAGDAASAAEHLRAALERIDAPAGQVQAALAYARALSLTEGLESAVRSLEWSGSGLTGDAALRVEVERTSLALYVTDRAAAAVEHMKTWSRLAGQSPTERLALATAALAHAFDPGAAASDAAPLARRALADGRLVAEQTASAPPFGNACYVLLFAEDLATLELEVGLALEDARARGSAFAFLTASLGACMFQLQRGHLASSIAHGEAAISTWPELRRTEVAERWISTAVCNLVQGLLDWGDADRARDLVRVWAAAGDLDSAELGMVRVARGLVAAADHDHAGALEDFLAYGELSRRAGYEDRTTPSRLRAARSAFALGHRDEAVGLADDAIAIARTWGAPGGLGAALRVRALLEEPVEARERLAEAVAVLQGSVCRLELARAEGALGVALLRCGRRTDGRAALRRGLDLATRCSASPLAEDLHAELRVAGARPRRLQISGVASLTASELRVARMAAAELTNRTIAQDLFVTPKTVESHLSNVYRKLGIDSRSRLAVLLDQASDDGPDRAPVPAAPFGGRA